MTAKNRPYNGPGYNLKLREPYDPDHIAPVFVRESPNNEATVQKFEDASLKIFYAAKGRTLSIQSVDGGVTWQDPVVEFAHGALAKYPRRTLLDQDGELHLTFFDENTNIYHTKTSHGRTSWETPTKILEGHIGAIRALTQLQNGRIVLAYHKRGIQGEAQLEKTGSSATTAIYSDDRGETWTPSRNLITAPVYPHFNGNNYGAVEPAILERRDGQIWLLMRSQTGFLWEAHSDDCAETWSAGRTSIFTSSNSPASFLRLPDGRIVLAWNNCREPDLRTFGRIYTNRDVLHAAISEDDGVTWRGFLEVFRDTSRDHQIDLGPGDHGTAYPNMGFTKEGKVILVSGQRDGLRAVLLFDPMFLYETAQETRFSGDLEPWCAYTLMSLERKPSRRPGPRLIPHPSKPETQVLFFNRRDQHFADAASWNFPAGRQGEIQLEVMFEPGADPIALSLTDHFRYPNDPDGENQAPFTFEAGASLIPAGVWHRLELTWNLAQEHCALFHDGRILTSVRPQRECVTGISYIRFRCLSSEVNTRGFLVNWIRVKTAQNLSLNAGL